MGERWGRCIVVVGGREVSGVEVKAAEAWR